MANRPLRVDLTSVEKFFLLAEFINVPVFQRDFQWRREHAEQLLEDIHNSFRDPIYFLGQVVVHEDVLAHAINLVDGQQRVTTLVILFLLLRTKLVDVQPFLWDRLHNMLCTQQSRITNYADQTTNADLARLIETPNGLSDLRRHSNAELRGGGVSKFMRRVREISDHFDNMLDEYFSDGEELPIFVEFALSRCFFSVITCETSDMGTDIFLSINSRGLPLSVLDNLKVLALKRQRAITTSAAVWANTLRTVGDVGMQNLLLSIAHLDEETYPLVQRGNWARIVRDYFVGRNQTSANWFMAQLTLYAPKFCFLTSRKPASFPISYRTYLMSLNTLGDSHIWAPTAMRFMEFYSTNSTRCPKFYQLLEKFATMISVINNGSRKTEQAKRILRDMPARIGNINASIRANNFDEIEAGLHLTRDEEEAFEYALTRAIYGAGVGRRVALHLLLRLEYESNSDTVYYDFDELTVEHVFNQSSPPADGWSTDDIVRYLNAIGNLTLLISSANKALRAKPYQEKAEVYAESGFHITRALAKNYETWTLDDCKDRHQQILNDLKRIYVLQNDITTTDIPEELELDDFDSFNELSAHEEIFMMTCALLRSAPVEANLDRNLLAEQGYELLSMHKDGNCQFEALAYSASDGRDGHKTVRETVVQWLRDNADSYLLDNGLSIRDTITPTLPQAPHGQDPFEIYLNDMERDGVWGDHITLLVAAQIYQVIIHIIRDNGDEPIIIEPWSTNDPDTPVRDCYLFYSGGNHYDSLRHLPPAAPHIETVEVVPVQAAPVEAAPVEAAPVETEPRETEPREAQTCEAKCVLGHLKVTPRAMQDCGNLKINGSSMCGICHSKEPKKPYARCNVHTDELYCPEHRKVVEKGAKKRAADATRARKKQKPEEAKANRGASSKRKSPPC